MSNLRIRKNLLGKTAPVTIPRLIKDLFGSGITEYNLRPIYQREIRWTTDAMNNLIETIMDNGLIPSIITYELDESEKTGSYEYEVIDGQHRMFTIDAFKTCKKITLPYSKKSHIVHWVYKNTDETGKYLGSERIFYEENDEVIQWCKELKITPLFLTTIEKSYFNNYKVGETKIDIKLSINQRREIFLSLQKGIQVSGSELLKNMVEVGLIDSFEKNGYQYKMFDVFFKVCSKKAQKYWVQWVAKFFLLYKNQCDGFEEEQCQTFLNMSDEKIKKLIRSGDPRFNPTEEVFKSFNEVFVNYINFLQRLVDKEDISLNPTQMFALFVHICNGNCDIDILITHMKYFSQDGNRSYYKKMWTTYDFEPRRIYFKRCLKQLQDMTERADVIDYKPISQSLYEKVWNKCVNHKCSICEVSEINRDDFEAGHIISRVQGGQIKIDNLIPMCFDCNRGMKTRNALEYKQDKFPHLFNKVDQVDQVDV